MKNQLFWFWSWRWGWMEAAVGKDGIDDDKDTLILQFWWLRFWWWRGGRWVEASVGKSQVETFALQRSLPHNGHFHPELRAPNIGMTNTILKHHLIQYFATPPNTIFCNLQNDLPATATLHYNNFASAATQFWPNWTAGHVKIISPQTWHHPHQFYTRWDP